MSSGLLVGFKISARARIEDRTILDSDDLVAVGGGKTDAQFAVAATPRMHGDAAAAGAMGIDEIIDRACDAGVRQCIDHDLAFTGAIGIHLPVLDGAAAANPKIAAERRDPLWAGLLDAHQMPAVGMIGHRFGLDGLAAERVGHEHGRAVSKGDAVAAVTDVIDGQAFNHGARR
jgi:hypothetical protein